MEFIQVGIVQEIKVQFCLASYYLTKISSDYSHTQSDGYSCSLVRFSKQTISLGHNHLFFPLPTLSLPLPPSLYLSPRCDHGEGRTMLTGETRVCDALRELACGSLDSGGDGSAGYRKRRGGGD